MKYGLNYQGSKNSIVKELCDTIPVKENFYDLFAGGGSVTHRMLVLNQFKRFIMCDVNPMPIGLFNDCIHGRVPSPRWISHEEFDKVKNSDSYAACCFCFGGDWHSYAYSEDSEPIKKAMHYAIVDLDFSYAYALGLDLHELAKYPTWQQRRLKLKEVAKRTDRLDEIQHLERHASLEHMEALVGLSKLSELEQLQRFTIRCSAYNDVDILPDSVLYCDPPYIRTKQYVAGNFDHNAFYDWCRRQDELVIISEYEMPDDFICIKEFERFDSKSFTKRKTVREKVFIPQHQEELYHSNKNTLF